MIFILLVFDGYSLRFYLFYLSDFFVVYVLNDVVGYF